MKLKISTAVNKSADEVWLGFDQALFLKLVPPFPKVKLLYFEGSKKGDKVGLELNFVLFKQKWISHITDNGESDQEIFFIDEGVELPFFLAKWKHRHGIERSLSGSVIVDEIEFSAGNTFFDLILFPGLYLQFLYRKPIYKKVFK